MSAQATSITELISTLQASMPILDAKQVYDILRSLVGADIIIRVEQPEPILNGLIKPYRILLTANRNKADFSKKLVQQCNGVVLQYPDWSVISMPAPIFAPQFRLSDVVRNIDDYITYPIQDGTVVTAYWYGGRWCMSSTNAFDVGAYKWLGDKTYDEVFEELSEMYPEFNLDELDHDYSYTIGFRHEDFHPLNTDKPKMWLIQATNLLALNGEDHKLLADPADDIGLPLQTPTVWPQNLRGKALLSHLQKYNSTALAQYLASAKTDVPTIHYGYIFRSRTGVAPDVMIESDLLKYIRTSMYNIPKPKAGMITPSTPSERLDYVILRAYLSRDKYTFLQLFSQFVPQYQKYDAIFGKLSNRIVSALRNRASRDLLFQAARVDNATLQNRLDRLAVSLIRYVESHGRINVMDRHGVGIVQDFIKEYKHLDLYYSLLVASA